MKWFYAKGDEQRGPLEADALGALWKEGSIDSKTLVWREGMPEWVTFSEVQSEILLDLKQSDAPAESARCSECGGTFPSDDLLEVKGLRVCAGCKPVFLQKLAQGRAVGQGMGVWRKRNQLVIATGAELPWRCVKCNGAAPAGGLRRKLFWHHSAYYLLVLLLGPLIYAIIAQIVRKRITLQVPICPAHRTRRLRNMLIGWALFVAALGAFIVGVQMAAARNADSFMGQALILTGIGLFLASITVFMLSRILVARRIETERAFVKGASGAYLAELPEWPGV